MATSNLKLIKVTEKLIEKEIKAVCKQFGIEFVSIDWNNEFHNYYGEFLVCVEDNTVISGRLFKFSKTREVTTFEFKLNVSKMMMPVLDKCESIIDKLARI